MNIFSTMRNWRRARKTHRELNNLSSRQLDDIGLTRADIASISKSVPMRMGW